MFLVLHLEVPVARLAAAQAELREDNSKVKSKEFALWVKDPIEILSTPVLEIFKIF